MDISLIATGIITAIMPYLTKSGEAFFEKAGESVFEKITSFFAKKNQKPPALFVASKQHGAISRTEIQELEQELTKLMNQDRGFRNEMEEAFVTSNTDRFVLEQILESIQPLRSELKELYKASANAGVGTAGDYENKIALSEQKLRKLESKFFEILNKRYGARS